MSNIHLNGINYSISDEKLPAVKDYLDMHADAVYEESQRPADIPDGATEINIDGIVYMFESAELGLMDFLDFNAESASEIR